MKQIYCRICKETIKDRKAFNMHLKNHKIKFRDYVEKNLDQFPNWRRCIICGNITNKKYTCSIKCNSEYLKTKTGEKSNRYGKHHSKETKKKISNKRLENQKLGKYEFLNGDTNPACRPEVRKKISETRKERGCGIGEKNSMYGKTHSPEAIKKIFSHRKMNKLEKLVADTLDKAGIKYTFQFFITDNGICKSYDFKIKGKPPYFLIVCAKLLTGFDAPCESVMYLDKPLKEHNLLQAIARTNRIEGPNKQNGLIVDYIGVTKYLNEALATYRHWEPLISGLPLNRKQMHL